MKGLDKTKKYGLSKLNDEKLREIFHWLQKNDGWYGLKLSLFKEYIDKYCLYYHENVKKWYFTTDMYNSTCATELFTDHIHEVGKNVEQANLNLESNPINGNIFSGLIDMASHANDLVEIANRIKKNNFKELDKSKVYDLSELSFKELQDINTHLFKIDLNWELFSDDELKQIERKETLWFDTDFIGWKIHNKTPTANAKELFTTDYEVTMISEQPKAYKETSNKLNYELDFNFITQMAERMAQNKHKYESYNWQKLDNIEDLKQALLRHVLDVLKGNYKDDGRAFAHLESIALNAMFINYQLNKNENNT